LLDALYSNGRHLKHISDAEASSGDDVSGGSTPGAAGDMQGSMSVALSPAPRCTVVLPTYNRLRTLPRAVASVLAQEMADFELIVVDDGSSDGTIAWLATQTDPRLRVIAPGRNQGVSVARNLGLAAATAPVVAFLDSDDVYRPNRLSVPLGVLEAQPDVAFTLSSAQKQMRDGHHVALLPDVKLAGAALEWALVCDLVGVETSSVTVRTDAARAAGGFCEVLRRTEDREFLIRVAQHSATSHGAARFLPDVLWEKSWLDDSLSNERLGAGRDLVAYVAQRPEYVGRFGAVGRYFAFRIMVDDLKRGHLATLARDLRGFQAAGLLAGPSHMLRDYRLVRAHRRAYSNSVALASLDGPPHGW
jgi:glycosyltransferase involved in cell wall biosynthesis